MRRWMRAKKLLERIKLVMKTASGYRGQPPPAQ